MNGKVSAFLSTCIFFCISLPVQAETVLEKIQRTGVLRVAIREDAPPFGYLNRNDDLEGYCLSFFNLLEKQLTKTLQRDVLSIKLLKSTANNRFDLVANSFADLECGPNTIRLDPPDDVSFSQAFFATGTQFLANEKKGDRLNLDDDLNEIRLGVIKDTTTEEFVTETYPLATIFRFSGVTARTRGVQAVAQDRIDAMVSDGILLRAQAQQQGLSASQYLLIPDIPLTCDRYGMIIGDEDPQWQDFVNSVIDSPRVVTLSERWFGELFDSKQLTSDVCELSDLKNSK